MSTGYKSFKKGMVCKGKQYKENTTYKENGNEICEAGVMHFCENPFDVLNYYPLIDENDNMSEFAEVEPLGEVYKDEDKSATNKLHIGAKLEFKNFVKTCIDFIVEEAKINKRGNSAQIANSGGYVQIANSGDYSQIISSGNSTKVISSGDGAKITSKGKRSVVMAAGYNSMAKAKVGSFITLAEWEPAYVEDEGDLCWIPKCVKTEYVDGERIKEDVFYKLENGEFVEVE